MQSFGYSDGNRLQRVAFKLSTGDTFYFKINPDSMEENFASRNVFLQPESGIQMQGFGPGLHTIIIQGTTGVRQITAGSSSYSIDDTAGFEQYHAMFDILKEQLDSVHDNETVSGTNTFGGVNLDYYDYTNEHYYHCELAPQGFTFTQSAENPLSYRYEVDLIVIGDASEASVSETSWLTLGNSIVGLSKLKTVAVPSIAPYTVPDTSLWTDSTIETKYSKGIYSLTDIRANSYAELISTVNNIESDMEKRGIDGFRSPIINYGDNMGKYYTYGKILSSDQITALYKKVYTGITTQVNLVVDNKNVLNINISDDNTTAWNAYWTKYTDTAKSMKNNNGVIDYGQSDANDSSNPDNSYNTSSIGNALYGNTVPTIDLTQYSDTDTIYKQLFGSVLSQFDGQEYIDAANAFSDGIETTILNYGQLDAGDTSKFIKPDDLNQIYNNLYVNNVTGFNYTQYLALGQLYIAMNGGDMSSFESPEIASSDATSDPVNSVNALPVPDVAEDLYSILFGTSLDSDSYTTFLDDVSAYNSASGLIEDYVGDQSSVVTDLDTGQDRSLGLVTYSNDNYDSDYENDNYYNRIVDEDSPDTDQWTDSTQNVQSDTSSLYALPGDNTSDNDTLSSKVSESSLGYVNPNVSTTAPMLGYNEISNILKVDESNIA